MDPGRGGLSMRPPSDVRSQADASRSDPARAGQPMGRAERFEDEKRRIISSCFSRRDESGKLVQSYITHIRVEEDGAYQSSPPPTGSNPQYKKPRLVILAVKASGRVSMHKARENDDGTFQIGKTWGLEELHSIESFANTLPKTPAQQERTDWAGPVGFIINISKPYYWRANSSKEKDFFIGSLVKIYNKFTGGKLPELIGFDAKDRDTIIASMRPPPKLRSPSNPQLHTQPYSPTISQPRSPSIPRQRQYSGGAPPREDHRRPSDGTPQFPPSLRSRASARQLGAANSSDRPQHSPHNRPPSNGPSPGSTVSNQRAPELMSRPSNGNMRGPRPYQLDRAPPTPSVDSSIASQPPQRNRAPSSATHIISSSAVSSTTTNVSGTSTLTSPAYQNDASNASLSPTAPSDSGNIQHRSAESQFAHAPSSRSGTDTTSLASSDKSRPKVSNEQSTTELSRTPSESISSKDTHAIRVGQYQADSPPQSIPERRRPPLQTSDDVSIRSIRSDTSSQRPSTPLSTTTRVISTGTPVDDRAMQSSLPQSEISKSASQRSTFDASAIEGHPTALTPTQSREAGMFTSETTPNGSPGPIGEEVQQFRPGLGPMMGKKVELANKMRKAALAHRAFVPRAGGAGDRLLSQSNKSKEPDRVTGVVLPARSLARGMSQTSSPPSSEPQQVEPQQAAVNEILEKHNRMSAPRSTTASSDDKRMSTSLNEIVSDYGGPIEAESPGLEADNYPESMPPPLVVHRQARSPERLLPTRKPNPFADALKHLGLDTSMALDGRAIDLEDQLNEFGWNRGFLQKKQFESLQARVRHEAGKIEAGSWLGRTEEGDDRIERFEKSIDKAINAVDEFDGLLTLYSVELSTLVDDVSYIEAQSQGLQVQTANQKLLQAELADLIETISLDAKQLEPLRRASLRDSEGIAAIETSLVLLYKALLKIDPNGINTTKASKRNGNTSSQGMQALQERKRLYSDEASTFLLRLQDHSRDMFEAAFSTLKTTASESSQMDINGHDLARANLWKYSALMLFAKELDTRCWDNIIKNYQAQASVIYTSEVNGIINESKKKAQKASSEDDFALFTTQEKEAETFTSAARKMTVKRSATLARSFRNTPHRDRSGNTRTPLASDCAPHEAFTSIVQAILPAICAEQNFMTDFFHATILESGDFLDAVGSEEPSQRKGSDVHSRRYPEPAGDRYMANRVQTTTKIVFQTWFVNSTGLIDWALDNDEFQRIGILATLERERLDLEDSNQDLLLNDLRTLFDNTKGPFEPFIIEQIKAIDGVKVKTNKRRGLMSFTRRLPNFVAAMENALPPIENSNARNARTSRSSDTTHQLREPYPETRGLVDVCYERIASAIFRNLVDIAKSSGQSTFGVGGNAEQEDKERLNHEILLIENMHYIARNLEPGASAVMTAWRARAEDKMLVSRDVYTKAVVRRPLGRLLDFMEAAGVRDGERLRHDRGAFKKALGGYDVRTCRRDIEALKKRVEKHFTPPQEGGALSGAGGDLAPTKNLKLIGEILDVCRGRFEDAIARAEAMARDYDPPVELEISRELVNAAWRG